MTVPSSYSKFKFEDLVEMGVTVDGGDIFFKEITPVKPGIQLLNILELNQQFPLGTEKARSEMLVFPILASLKLLNNEFTIFSGYQFDVDKARGLKGHCDFLLAKSPSSRFIKAPVIAVVEAKNDNVDEGVPQCVAEMMAAKIFNERRGEPEKAIHGIVTSGMEWLFLRLDDGNRVTSHNERFGLSNLEELLGALQTVIDFYKN